MLNFELSKNPKSYIMRKATTYEAAFRSVLLFFCYVLSILFCYTISAQRLKKSTTSYIEETEKKVQDYQDLKSLGYTDKEIYEDLGNVYFMSKKYETALFWYSKLETTQEGAALPANYQERYNYALAKTASVDLDNKDWMSLIKADYEIKDNLRGKTPKFNSKGHNSLAIHDQVDQFFEEQHSEDNGITSLNVQPLDNKDPYTAPLAMSPDGNTAYFTKAVYVKPTYGMFSKKQLVHRIYKAEKENGEWKHIKQVNLCPKNFSSMHPAISQDGKRLFFASNMPGTFGKYDIYVSNIYNDGSIGIAKNLGEKVNSNKNDLYPNIVDSNTLFFASEGRKGYGGMDIYMAQVGQKKVQWSVNLGSPINSSEDDFTIFLSDEKGMGYVMSNRGKNKGPVQRVAFSYLAKRNNTSKATMEYNLLDALNTSSKVDYSNAFFEDE